MWVSIGPYGGHFGPLTGDPSGEAKANFVGFLAEDDGDMEELVGDGDGIREPGEVWGFPVGGDLTGDAVRLRRPPFIAPADGAGEHTCATRRAPSPIHFDNEPQWKIELWLPGQVRYAIGPHRHDRAAAARPGARGDRNRHRHLRRTGRDRSPRRP